MSIRIPYTSEEYLTASLEGAPSDLTESTVEAALELESVDAADVSWSTASWAPGTTWPTVRWLYEGDKAKGTYVFWSRVHDSPETPVRRHDTVYLD